MSRPEGSSETFPLLFGQGLLVLRDRDFFSPVLGQSPWFKLGLGAPQGTGILMVSRRDNGSQLTSFPMNLTPSETWEFDHLGNSGHSWWNGVVLLNTTGFTNTVTLTGYDATHHVIHMQDLELGPYEKLSDTLGHLTGAAGLSQMTITAELPILAILLIGRQDRELLTVVHGNTPLASLFSSAYLPSREDGWVGLSMMNPSDQKNPLEVTAYNESGQPSTVATFEVEAWQKKVILLSDYINRPWMYNQLQVKGGAPFRVYGLTGSFKYSQLGTLPFQAIEE